MMNESDRRKIEEFVERKYPDQSGYELLHYKTRMLYEWENILLMQSQGMGPPLYRDVDDWLVTFERR